MLNRIYWIRPGGFNSSFARTSWARLRKFNFKQQNSSLTQSTGSIKFRQRDKKRSNRWPAGCSTVCRKATINSPSAFGHSFSFASFSVLWLKLKVTTVCCLDRESRFVTQCVLKTTAIYDRAVFISHRCGSLASNGPNFRGSLKERLKRIFSMHRQRLASVRKELPWLQSV